MFSPPFTRISISNFPLKSFSRNHLSNFFLGKAPCCESVCKVHGKFINRESSLHSDTHTHTFPLCVISLTDFRFSHPIWSQALSFDIAWKMLRKLTQTVWCCANGTNVIRTHAHSLTHRHRNRRMHTRTHTHNRTEHHQHGQLVPRTFWHNLLFQLSVSVHVTNLSVLFYIFVFARDTFPYLMKRWAYFGVVFVLSFVATQEEEKFRQ